MRIVGLDYISFVDLVRPISSGMTMLPEECSWLSIKADAASFRMPPLKYIGYGANLCLNYVQSAPRKRKCQGF